MLFYEKDTIETLTSMIRYNTITTIWLVGALTFILSALLLAFHVRCKAKQISPPRFLWLIVFSNLLLALDMLVHLHGCYFDTDATASCAIDIAFLLLLIPIYYFALSDVLRKTSEKETPSDPQSTESHHPVTEEPLTLSVEEPLTSPADDILPQTISSEKIVAQWISERHFTDPEITIDKALEQMNISISVLNYYIEQYTNSGTFRRWLSHRNHPK